MQKAIVIDMDSATKPGQQYRTVATFTALDATQKAENFLAEYADQDKVRRGGFGIDVSEYCFGCRNWHSPEAECYDC